MITSKLSSSNSSDTSYHINDRINEEEDRGEAGDKKAVDDQGIKGKDDDGDDDIEEEEDEADYDSEVLSDSDSDSSDNDGDEDEEDDDDDNDEDDDVDDTLSTDQDYLNFLSSIRNYDLDSLEDDEDDDGEYKPHQHHYNGNHQRTDGENDTNDTNDSNDDDDDDESCDTGLVKVAKHELIELLDGCLQTIAGEAPIIPAMASTMDIMTPGYNQLPPRSSVEHDSDLQSPSFHVLGLHDGQAQPHGNVASSNGHTTQLGNRGGEHTTSGAGDNNVDDDELTDLAPSESSNHFAQAVERAMPSLADMKTSGLGKKTSSIMTKIVSQMFSGGARGIDVCVEGMPVEAVRKLVARQMSMSIQLLIQLVILAGEDSECYSNCVSWIAELAAHRDSSVKKAALMAMSVKSVIACRSQGSDGVAASSRYQSALLDANSVNGKSDSNTGMLPPAGIPRVVPREKYSQSSKANVSETISTASDIVGSRVTRGLMKRKAAGDGVRTSTSSVLDIPVLNYLPELLEMIKTARHRLQNQLTEENRRQSHVSAAAFPHPSSDCLSNFSVNEAQQYLNYYLVALKSVKSSMSTIAARTGMRCWESLQPTTSFPLSAEWLENSFLVNDESLKRNAEFSSGVDNSRPSKRCRTIESAKSTIIFDVVGDSLFRSGSALSRFLHSDLSTSPIVSCIEPDIGAVTMSTSAIPYDTPVGPSAPSKGESSESAVSTCSFVPAESDLLLRGMILFKHWAKIVENLLPNKTEKELAAHFASMVSLSAPENNKFKMFMRLEEERKGKDHWSHTEDLELLRGFQIFGSKWQLYPLYFLPHRRKHHLRLRWTAIQKLAVGDIVNGEDNSSSNPNYSYHSIDSKGAASSSGHSSQKGEVLSPAAELFLTILRTIDPADPSVGLGNQRFALFHSKGADGKTVLSANSLASGLGTSDRNISVRMDADHEFGNDRESEQADEDQLDDSDADNETETQMRDAHIPCDQDRWPVVGSKEGQNQHLQSSAVSQPSYPKDAKRLRVDEPISLEVASNIASAPAQQSASGLVGLGSLVVDPFSTALNINNLLPQFDNYGVPVTTGPTILDPTQISMLGFGQNAFGQNLPLDSATLQMQMQMQMQFQMQYQMQLQMMSMGLGASMPGFGMPFGMSMPAPVVASPATIPPDGAGISAALLENGNRTVELPDSGRVASSEESNPTKERTAIDAPTTVQEEIRQITVNPSVGDKLDDLISPTISGAPIPVGNDSSSSSSSISGLPTGAGQAFDLQSLNLLNQFGMFPTMFPQPFMMPGFNMMSQASGPGMTNMPLGYNMPLALSYPAMPMNFPAMLPQGNPAGTYFGMNPDMSGNPGTINIPVPIAIPVPMTGLPMMPNYGGNSSQVAPQQQKEN